MPPIGRAGNVEIGGAGYALVPGGYARAQQGTFGHRTGRVDLGDFGGGQRQPLHREEGRAWDAVGTAVYGGQGVEPWPNIASHGDTLATTPTAAARPRARRRRPRLRDRRSAPLPDGRADQVGPDKPLAGRPPARPRHDRPDTKTV